MNQSTQTSDYFDLHGVLRGYLSRVRWIEPRGRKQDRALYCSILAYRDQGKSRTFFDLKVAGKEAQTLIDQFGKELDQGKHVFVEVRAGDFYVHAYENAKGEPNICLKGRLLKVLNHEVHSHELRDAMIKKYGGEIEARGLAYLNRAASPSINGEPTQVVSFWAFHGQIGDLNYVQFNAQVAASAKAMLDRLVPHLPKRKGEKSPVLFGFRLDNIFPSSFTYARGQHAGEIGYEIKGRLTDITWAKVNGMSIDIDQQAVA